MSCGDSERRWLRWRAGSGRRTGCCKEKEQKRSDYHKAVEADNAAIRRGDFNFKGIGLGKED